MDTTSPETAMSEICEYYNYTLSEATVQTADGYLLKLYRISGGPSSPPATGKKVVIVQHGYFVTTIDWIKFGPEQSLPFALSDAGYDVWLPNTRGNTLSRKHVTLDPNSNAFWDFTVHEIGLQDFPALIDHVLSATGQAKLHFVGWSGASTAFLALGSENTAYMSKIYSAHFLSPAAYFTHAISPFFRFLSTNPGGFDVSKFFEENFR